MKAVLWNISFMYSGFILFSVLNISRARAPSRFTSIIDSPDLFKIDPKSLEKLL